VLEESIGRVYKLEESIRVYLMISISQIFRIFSY